MPTVQGEKKPIKEGLMVWFNIETVSIWVIIGVIVAGLGCIFAALWAEVLTDRERLKKETYAKAEKIGANRRKLGGIIEHYRRPKGGYNGRL